MKQQPSSYLPYFLVVLGAVFVLPLAMVFSQAFGMNQVGSTAVMVLSLVVLMWVCFVAKAEAIAALKIPKSILLGAGLIAFAAGLALGGIGLFMANVEQKGYVWHHHQDFGVKHNCFTCYTMAAFCDRDHVGNVYDPKTLSKPKSAPLLKTLAGQFRVDAYPYPPPFLLVHRGLITVSEDFFVLRRIWYLIVVVFCLWGALSLVAWAGGTTFNPGLLFLPVLLLAPSTLTAIQIQNVHPLVIISSLVGMMAFSRNRNLLGSLCLAFAITCKIWPLVLLVPLVLARKWRSIISTILGLITLGVLSRLTFGTGIFHDFVQFQLPRLASGEAFGFMTKHAGAMTANTSIFGFWHKLYEVGVFSGKPPELLNPILSWGYLFVAAAVILWASWASKRLFHLAFKDHEEGQKARLKLLTIWLAILTLVQLRSPFLPWPYGVLTTQGLFIILAVQGQGKTRWLFILGWIYYAVYIPFPGGHATLNFIYGMVGTALMFAISVFALWRSTRRNGPITVP